ncbi:hypothetical protein H2203_006026 [Taxawa tesnikishii (nom. ined.)]|nr:hypothetical protein H2203_006026 [Dothideales sp. JES 119]
MSLTLRAAACHASPIFLSSRDTTQKCISLIQRAASNGANLVVFPEAFIPAFPIWSSLRPPTENHDLFARMARESICADGEEIRAIRAAAKQTGTVVSVGISERVRYSSATLFNSNLLIDASGTVVVHHRKLMPTFFEKLTWSPGDGHGLRVAETPVGKIGNLICGENTNPLARYALMAQGEQVHISSWPAIWPTRVPKTQVAGAGGESVTEAQGGSSVSKGANYDNVSANRTRAAAHCFEAKCFGIMCAGHLDASAIDAVVSGSTHPKALKDALEKSPRGATMFLDPTGALLPGFTVDATPERKQTTKDLLQTEEDILYVDMNLEDCVEGKQYHDVVGGYQRFDVFDLKINRTRREPATFIDDAPDVWH